MRCMLKPIGVLLLSVFIGPGCGSSIVQVENSFSGDGSRYGTEFDSSSAFGQARVVMSNRCAQCHAEFVSRTESQWVSLNLVVAGNATGSSLYGRLRGSGVGGVENMPPSGTLTTQELDAVRNWINGLR
jgi:hypothetical protein